uniref:Uncharacterized protein n=1 Tax=Noctiluca scintillans TaxID=2966 RepID=A0A7S0ZUW9_NOCSC
MTVKEETIESSNVVSSVVRVKEVDHIDFQKLRPGGAFILENKASKWEDPVLKGREALLRSKNGELATDLSSSLLEVAQAKTETVIFKSFADLVPGLKRLHDDCHSEAAHQLQLEMGAHYRAESEQKRRRLYQVEGEMQRLDVDQSTIDASRIALQNQLGSCVDEAARVHRIGTTLDLQLSEARAQAASLDSAIQVLRDEARKTTEHLTKQDGGLICVRARLDSRVGVAVVAGKDSEGSVKQVIQLEDQASSLEAHLQRRNQLIGDLDVQVKQWHEALSSQTHRTSQLQGVVAQLEKDRDILKGNVTSLSKESAEKTEILARRVTSIEGKNAAIERLKVEMLILRSSLESNKLDIEKKNIWALGARKETTHTVEEWKKLEVKLGRMVADLIKAQAMLKEKDVLVDHHRQKVSESTVESDAMQAAAGHGAEQIEVQKQSFLVATKNTKVMESNIASKGLEIQRLLGVISTLGAREREEAANIARLHTRVFTLETSIQQLRLTASTPHSEDTRVSQLEMELRSAVDKHSTLRQEYETLVSQGVAKRNEARATRVADYEEEIRGYQEHLETLKAEILTLRAIGMRVRSDMDALDSVALAQVLHRERENSALLEAQVHASFEQLAKKEDELRRARSAQRVSDARVGNLAAEAQCKRDVFVATKHSHTTSVTD